METPSATGSELAHRLRRVEDKAALWELVSRYAVAIDRDDYDAMAQMLTDESEFVGIGADPVRGRDEVIAYMRSRVDTRYARRMHTPTNQVIEELTDDSARGVVYSYAALEDYEGAHSFIALRYEDIYACVQGSWRFARRHIANVVRILPG